MLKELVSFENRLPYLPVAAEGVCKWGWVNLGSLKAFRKYGPNLVTP